MIINPPNKRSLSAFASDPTDETTRQKILDCAIACINRWGIEKTSLSLIAKEAGVARSTIYMYYASREDVIDTAMLQSGKSFMHLLLEHVEGLESPQERLVEAFVFLLNNVTDAGFLKTLSEKDPSKNIDRVVNGLMSESGRKLVRTVISLCLGSRSALDETELDEITDICTGLAIGLLKSGSPRSTSEMVAFLRKRMLPAVGF